MARVNLPYVQRFRDRHGKVRHYYRRPGCERVPLPGQPGSSEFLAAYQVAQQAVRAVGEGRTPPGSISGLIVAYYQSPEWRRLNPTSQRTTRLILDRFRAEYGMGPAAQFQEQHLRRILDKMPGAWPAKNLLKRLRAVFKFAVSRNLVRHDPTRGVVVKVPASDGFRAWTDEDIERFEARWPAGSRARLALSLLLFTGQRRSDVVRMGFQHVRNHELKVRQQKTGAELWIPLHPELQAELERIAGQNLTFLVTAAGKPFSPPGFSNWFSECAQQAGLPKNSSPHGLRKAAARRLAEAGCSAMQVAAITGHASLKEVERYTKSAAQRRLAQSAMEALSASRRA